MGVQPEKKLFWKLVKSRFFFFRTLTVILSSSLSSFSSSSRMDFTTDACSGVVWPSSPISFSTCSSTRAGARQSQNRGLQQTQTAWMNQIHVFLVVASVCFGLIYLICGSTRRRLEEGGFRTVEGGFLKRCRVFGNHFCRILKGADSLKETKNILDTTQSCKPESWGGAAWLQMLHLFDIKTDLKVCEIFWLPWICLSSCSEHLTH